MRLSEYEQQRLTAAEEFLGLTDPEDWHLLHYTIAGDVAEGKLSRDFEAAYKELVNRLVEALPPDPRPR